MTCENASAPSICIRNKRPDRVVQDRIEHVIEARSTNTRIPEPVRFGPF